MLFWDDNDPSIKAQNRLWLLLRTSFTTLEKINPYFTVPRDGPSALMTPVFRFEATNIDDYDDQYANETHENFNKMPIVHYVVCPYQGFKEGAIFVVWFNKSGALKSRHHSSRLCSKIRPSTLIVFKLPKVPHSDEIYNPNKQDLKKFCVTFLILHSFVILHFFAIQTHFPLSIHSFCYVMGLVNFS